MNLYGLSNILIVISSLSMAIFVFIKGRTSRTAKLWSIFALSVAIYGFGAYMVTNAQNVAEAISWWKVSYIGIILIPFLFIIFNFEYLGIKHPLFVKIFGFCTALLLLVNFLFRKLFITDVYLYFRGWRYVKPVYFVFPAGPLLLFFIIFIYFGVPVYIIFKLIKRYKISSGAKQNQIKYFLVACILGFPGGGLSFLPCFGIQFYPIFNFTVALYPFIMAYAIFRYRFMDINVALTRAGVFAIVYILVLGIPFAIAGWGKSLLINLFGNNWFWFSLVIFFILATAGPFIVIYLMRRTEAVLFKERRRYQEAINNLSKNMIDIRDIEKLFTTITSTITDAVKIKFATIYLKQDEYKSFQLKSSYPQEAKLRFQEFIPLKDPLIDILNQRKKPLLSEEIGHQEKINLDSGLAVPCFGKDGLIAFLILGAKQNNQMYTNDDLLVFENLSYATSLAIENCIYWKEIEDRHRKARLQEMDTYSYSLAHEIDNPMQVILGETDFLKKFFLKEIDLSSEKRKEADDMFNFILEAARRVSGMVKAIRDFGQKTTGEFKPLNIEEVVESFTRLYYPQFKDKTVLFEKTLNLKNPMFVLGEKPELMQVLVILANNSVHAMTGLKEKKASLRLEAINHDWVRIHFSDNGYGIKKENLEIIFKPFTTTKASTEGTGMGLHNAKKIIERHKGRIWVESEGEGRGATFVIELPIAKDVKPQESGESKDKRLF